MLIACAPAMACAAKVKPPKDAPICAGPQTKPVFLSPAGEPFRGEPGSVYPSATWFAGADRDHDGAIAQGELVSDALLFFERLDRNHDRRLTPDEVKAYERFVAPETSLFLPERGANEDRRDRGGGLRRSADYGGPMGAGRYSWLNVPEPVAAADQDIDRIVTADEFASAAAAAFARLDVLNRGKLRLQDLPRTPQQVAIEGPCRPRKPPRRNADDGEN